MVREDESTSSSLEEDTFAHLLLCSVPNTVGCGLRNKAIVFYCVRCRKIGWGPSENIWLLCENRTGFRAKGWAVVQSHPLFTATVPRWSRWVPAPLQLWALAAWGARFRLSRGQWAGVSPFICSLLPSPHLVFLTGQERTGAGRRNLSLTTASVFGWHRHAESLRSALSLLQLGHLHRCWAWLGTVVIVPGSCFHACFQPVREHLERWGEWAGSRHLKQEPVCCCHPSLSVVVVVGGFCSLPGSPLFAAGSGTLAMSPVIGWGSSMCHPP